MRGLDVFISLYRSFYSLFYWRWLLLLPQRDLEFLTMAEPAENNFNKKKRTHSDVRKELEVGNQPH